MDIRVPWFLSSPRRPPMASDYHGFLFNHSRVHLEALVTALESWQPRPGRAKVKPGNVGKNHIEEAR